MRTLLVLGFVNQPVLCPLRISRHDILLGPGTGIHDAASPVEASFRDPRQAGSQYQKYLILACRGNRRATLLETSRASCQLICGGHKGDVHLFDKLN